MDKKEKQEPDRLSYDELQVFKEPLYVPGRPYLWTLTFGWSIVGFYVRHETPLRIRVAHANHFRNAGKDYGKLMQEGAGPECEWRYEGDSEISFQHVVKVGEYHGIVPRSPIRS